MLLTCIHDTFKLLDQVAFMYNFGLEREVGWEHQGERGGGSRGEVP